MDHPVQTDFLRWIVLFPLLGAAVNGLLGARIQERLGKRMVALIACAPVSLSFLFSLWAFSRLLSLPAKERFLIDHFYSWIPMGSFNVDVAFWVDPLSAIMILVVSGIGGLIHFYSIGYMHDDPVPVALLRLPEPVHLLHAAAGDRRQLAADVRGLGGRGAVLLGAHRVLVYRPHQHAGRQQGFHRQPGRRLRLSSWASSCSTGV